MSATTVRWIMPDGTSRYETTEECPDCHHHHTPTWGGICVGCPCPNVIDSEYHGDTAPSPAPGDET